jgi:uncharacterized protein
MISLKHFFNPYIKLRKSGIHSRGIFAKKDIKKGKYIIEYLGDKISKEEAEIIGDESFKKSEKDKNKGAVYLFNLNKKEDLDGDRWYNLAKYVNHSCDENCEAIEDKGKVWIAAMKNIKKGEELTFDYAYSDLDDYEDHPCRCGSKNCCGYILVKSKRKEIKK